MMMRKRLLSVILLVLMLVGCASPSQSLSALDSVSVAPSESVGGPSELTPYNTISARIGNPSEAENLTVWALRGVYPNMLPIALQNLRAYNVDNAWDYNIQVELGVLPPVLALGEVPDAITENYNYEDLQQAQQQLITELLAGEGPDVIFLDGCYAQDFADRGVLMDIGDVAHEAGVYDNLIESLQINGTLYYVPQNMAAPLLWGDPAYMDDVQDFTGLAQTLYNGPRPAWADIHKDNLDELGDVRRNPNDPIALFEQPLPQIQRTLMGYFDDYALWQIAGPLFGTRLVQDSNLDTGLLKEQYMAMKQMLETTAAASSPRLVFHAAYMGNLWFMDDISVARYLGYTHLAASGINYVSTSLSALARSESLEVRPFPAEGAVWQPKFLMAVNKNAKNPELAKHFIKLMLGDEQTLIPHLYYGDKVQNMLAATTTDLSTIPVTQSAIAQIQNKLFADNLQKEYTWNAGFENATDTYESLYTNKGIDMRWMSEAEGLPYDLDALMRQFDTAYLPSDYVANAVLANFNRYRDGELTLDEAVAACEADVALYLAERQ